MSHVGVDAAAEVQPAGQASEPSVLASRSHVKLVSVAVPVHDAGTVVAVPVHDAGTVVAVPVHVAPVAYVVWVQPAYGVSTAVQSCTVQPSYGVLTAVHAGVVQPAYGVSTAVHVVSQPVYGVSASSVHAGGVHIRAAPHRADPEGGELLPQGTVVACVPGRAIASEAAAGKWDF